LWRAGAWLALLCGIVLLHNASALAEEILVDGIAAQVGSQLVLASEIEEIARPVIERMRAAGVPEPQILQMRKDALERLIESKLIDNVVQQLELSASKTEIDGAIESIARDTGLSLGQLAESVAGYGMTFEEYRLKIKSEIERDKVLGSMVRSKVKVPESEVVALYAKRFGDQHTGGQEVHLRHIMVGFDPESPMSHASACQRVATAREQIVSGKTSFSEAAQQISDANPETGGELGWIHMQDLAGWMAADLLTMNQANPISPVIDMPFGCNLLKLVERRTFYPLTLEDARPQLERELFRSKNEEEYVAWVNVLRGRTFIERKGIYAVSSVAEASADTP
jgi:peptidyl-prolyl cis-trans isomerase SurA